MSRSSPRWLGAIAPIASALALTSAAAQTKPDSPKPATVKASPSSGINIPFEKYTLANGLTVILSQDKSTPTVAVEVMYHVGSKNEEVGRTGFAHLFEHVMFTGSGHVPYGMHDKFTEGVGGSNNGSTSNDVTQYYETIPANYLEHALWMEADRMGWLLDALDTAKYNAQRDIVANERRQRVDNVPYGRAGEIIDEAMYPASNPYSWPVVGHMADLNRAPLDAVKDFFRLYYAPNNATVTIVGDFDKVETKKLISKYFGDVNKGKPIVRPNVAPVTLGGERRLVYEDSVKVPRLYITWPTVSLKSPDRYALSALGSVLTGSRTARLTKELVYNRQWVTSVSAGQGSDEAAGQFQITATPRGGVSLTQIQRAIDSIVAKVAAEGPNADEVSRSKAGAQFGFVRGLESNLGKAQQLANNQTMYGDPAYSFGTAYPAGQAVTPADVKRVAAKYLGTSRIVLSVVPGGQKNLAADPDASIPVTEANRAQWTRGGGR